MITMADSIIPENLPPTTGTYLVYVDGHWPTADRVRELFPGARLLTMTVLGGDAVADGCDCETGDLTPAQAAAWAKARLDAGAWRPVIYASASAMQGTPDAPGVLPELAALGVARERVRLLSAHYGQGNHVCAPKAGPDDTIHCGATPVAMDGTQWSDTTPGVGGTLIDLSTLEDDFFGAIAPVTVEADVTLTQLENGSTGQAVQNWQGLLVAHGLGYMIATGKGNVMQYAGVDGQFGAKTEATTRKFQAGAGLPQTGVVDAATWQKALG
jgi:peptidoglycan hydrolase-like protein with peptidoglycan-binding domain